MSRSRRGHSLLELSVTIGLASIAMTMGTRTLITLMRSETTTRRAVTSDASLARLATRFREEVHNATQVEIVAARKDASQQLRVTRFDGRVVLFRPGRGSIEVTVQKGGKREAYEMYRLGSGTTRFDAAQDGRKLALTYETGGAARGRDPSLPASRRKTIRIDAIRGRDLRFARRKQP